MTDTPDAASLRAEIARIVDRHANWTPGSFSSLVGEQVARRSRALSKADEILALLPQEPGEVPGGWRPIDDEAQSGRRVLVGWRAQGGLGEHVELGRYVHPHWVNTYGKAFNGAPDMWAPLAPMVAQSRASKAEAERDELRGLLETTRDYLLEMSENQLRNDIDMRLDPIKDPELVASDITATLAKGDGA